MEHEDRQYLKVQEIKERIKSSDPFPSIIEIHPSRLCNSRCSYCFHKNQAPADSKNYLTIDNYKKLFVEIRKLGIDHLSISGGGEPAMNKQLPKIIEEAHKNKLSVRLVTNGSVIDSELYKRLNIIDEIRISLDAIKGNTYSKIRNVPEKIFNEVMNNLKKIVSLRDSKKLNIKIGVSYMLNETNCRETLEFCSEMLEIGVDSIIIKNDVYKNFKTSGNVTKKISSGIRRLKSDKIEFRKSKNWRTGGIKCYMSYFKIAIDTCGIVYSCCLAAQPGSKEGFVLGDITHNSLAEIWEISSKRRLLARTHGVNCGFCNYTDFNINNLFI